MRVASIEAVIEQVVEASPSRVQDRTRQGMRLVLDALDQGATIRDAENRAAVAHQTVASWRAKYPLFDQAVRERSQRNQSIRRRTRELEQRAEAEASGLILPYDKPVPDPGRLADFRWKYFGRPTPPHMETAVMALEDLTNLYVFIYGPTGMGKDTLAMDYAAWRQAPDRTGRRITTIMKTAQKAERRLVRMSRYLTDPSVYRTAPDRTPGGQKPTGSLIEDYGPFRWQPGMEWEDGTEVKRLPWNSDGLFFVYSGTPEQDPNWQALGVGGALQGDRVDEAILSDIFDLENQQSPTERRKQLDWTNGILHSRLDDAGRLVVLGNWLHIPNNYEEILSRYLEDAQVVERHTIGPGTYTKYNNGVAVVIIKAIYTDPDTGEDRSYWPGRFPLHDQLVSPQRKTRDASGLTTEQLVEYGQKGWKRRRGLNSTRSKDPVIFRAMYQQERDADVAYADFDDTTLATAYDHTRSWRQVFPHETRLIAVDPARRYGAGWVGLAVDRQNQVITPFDYQWFTDLGYTGIKDNLILRPLALWQPQWLCYEDNREGAVLAEPGIQRVIKDTGVGLFTHTTGQERGNREIGPGAIAAEMRAGRFKLPYATSEDRARTATYVAQLKAWDANPDRSKAGRPGHDPDDLCMATWIGCLKGWTFLTRSKLRGIVYGVPDAIRNRLNTHTRGPLTRDHLPRHTTAEILAHATGTHPDDPDL